MGVNICLLIFFLFCFFNEKESFVLMFYKVCFFRVLFSDVLIFKIVREEIVNFFVNIEDVINIIVKKIFMIMLYLKNKISFIVKYVYNDIVNF